MSPLAHALLVCAAMMCAACAYVPNMPNPCTTLDIGDSSHKLDNSTLVIEQELEVDLTAHLIDIDNYCERLNHVLGVRYSLVLEEVIACHLPLVHLYALGPDKDIFSPMVAYCEKNCKKQPVKVIQHCHRKVV